MAKYRDIMEYGPFPCVVVSKSQRNIWLFVDQDIRIWLGLYASRVELSYDLYHYDTECIVADSHNRPIWWDMILRLEETLDIRFRLNIEGEYV